MPCYLEIAEKGRPELVYSMVKETFEQGVRSSCNFKAKLPSLLDVCKKHPELLRNN